MTNAFREALLDRIIRIYGFENEVTIQFARAIESPYLTDHDLEILVKTHEENPIGFEDEDE